MRCWRLGVTTSSLVDYEELYYSLVVQTLALAARVALVLILPLLLPKELVQGRSVCCGLACALMVRVQRWPEVSGPLW